jgi:hypothetical protein
MKIRLKRGVEKMEVIEEIKKVKIVAGASRGDFSIMEARLLDADGNRIGSKYLSCDELKEKGIIKRSNSFKKAEDWLNTSEGIEWVSTANHYQIF